MPRSERAKKATVFRLPAALPFEVGEVVILYEPSAPFGELCFVSVREVSRARVVVNYYGGTITFRGEGRSGAWSSKDGRYRVERRNPERVAASLRLRCGESADESGPKAAKKPKE